MSRELDATVAEKVMGQTLLWIHEIKAWVVSVRDAALVSDQPAQLAIDFEVPHYTTDAAADYLVLQKVRETWDESKRHKWHDYLMALWRSRWNDDYVSHRDLILQYQPGDYSRAALKAMEG